MYLFIIGIILIALGAFICLKGDGSRFSPPTGGGSRISPEAQVRLNESVQRISGYKEDYASYYHNNNVFRFNKWGILSIILGLALVLLNYIL
jgi:hypothetical protein